MCVAGFIPHPPNFPGSTGRIVLRAAHRRENGRAVMAARKPCNRSTSPMVASPSTPRNGENVSDGEFDEQKFLLEYVDGQVDGILDDLQRHTVCEGNTLEDRYQAVQRARYHLGLLEAALASQLEGDELDVLTDMEELRQ